MRILGIDTATRIGSVGLVEHGRVVAERSAMAHPGHGGMLAPLIQRLLADTGWSLRSVEAVAVSIGPGSFTGLRIGLSLAKGLAYAGKARLLPVPTLDALAAVAGAEPGEFVCPILDARKGELYAALYAVTARGELEPRRAAALLRAEELPACIPGRCRFLGDGVETAGEFLEATLGGRALVLPFTHYHPRGGAVALLGAAEHAVGDGAALGALEPHYIRPAYVQIGRPAGAAKGDPGAR